MSQGYGPPPPGGYGPPPPGGGYGPPGGGYGPPPPGGGYGPPPPGGGYGPSPYPQPPRRSYAAVWAIIAVAVIVLAGGSIGAYFLLSGGDDSGSSSHGTTSVAYVNACDVLQPAQLRTLIPQVPSAQMRVHETYSEKPSVTVASDVETVQSTCHIEPIGDDYSGPNTQLSISMVTDPSHMPSADGFTGDPVSGVPDARAQQASDKTIVEWIHGSDILTLSADGAVPAAQIPTMISTLNQRVDQHPAAVQPLAPVQQAGVTVVVDACTLLTADDFKSVLGTAPDPAHVEREYQLPVGVPDDGTVWASCKRQSPAGSGDEKAATVDLGYFTSAADARSFAAGEGGTPVPGLGDGAWLGGDSDELRVVRGNVYMSFMSGSDHADKKLAAAVVAKVG